MSTGWIYLITDGTYVKIGLTTRDVDKRNRQHQTGNPREIKTLYKFKTRNVHRVEKELHDLFKKKHIRGEWFNLSDRDIKKIQNMYPGGTVWMSFKDQLKLLGQAFKFLIFRKD